MSGAPAPTGLSNLELLQDALDGIASLRTRVVWLVGRPGTGKTTLLRQLAQARPDCEYINVNRELAKALFDRPASARPFDAPGRLSEVLPSRASGAWLADNTELPLSRELQLAVVERFKAIAFCARRRATAPSTPRPASIITLMSASGTGAVA